MAELIGLVTALVALMKSMDMHSTVIMTVMFCALLVLFFNVIALWKLTAPVRKLSDSLDQFAGTFTTKMNDGERRFERNESDLVSIKNEMKLIKVHIGLS